jgi:hypothetical protein
LSWASLSQFRRSPLPISAYTSTDWAVGHLKVLADANGIADANSIEDVDWAVGHLSTDWAVGVDWAVETPTPRALAAALGIPVASLITHPQLHPDLYDALSALLDDVLSGVWLARADVDPFTPQVVAAALVTMTSKLGVQAL